MPHPIDTHKIAVDYANTNTRIRFGDNSVPCKPGSKVHDYWLIQFDAGWANNVLRARKYPSCP